ncbi:hypothetical protein BC832DRAFT_591743 [Gaertneriomyces semiglobifer]|nr:hypothetical protein BC832DRAFT_591743 [Gaertneriomyces semiglobifer]
MPPQSGQHPHFRLQRTHRALPTEEPADGPSPSPPPSTSSNSSLNNDLSYIRSGLAKLSQPSHFPNRTLRPTFLAPKDRQWKLPDIVDTHHTEDKRKLSGRRRSVHLPALNSQHVPPHGHSSTLPNNNISHLPRLLTPVQNLTLPSIHRAPTHSHQHPPSARRKSTAGTKPRSAISRDRYTGYLETYILNQQIHMGEEEMNITPAVRKGNGMASERRSVVKFPPLVERGGAIR